MLGTKGQLPQEGIPGKDPDELRARAAPVVCLLFQPEFSVIKVSEIIAMDFPCDFSGKSSALAPMPTHPHLVPCSLQELKEASTSGL